MLTHSKCKVVLTRSKRKESLIGDELVESVLEDMSDNEEVIG